MSINCYVSNVQFLVYSSLAAFAYYITALVEYFQLKFVIGHRLQERRTSRRTSQIKQKAMKRSKRQASLEGSVKLEYAGTYGNVGSKFTGLRPSIAHIVDFYFTQQKGLHRTRINKKS